MSGRHLVRRARSVETTPSGLTQRNNVLDVLIGALALIAVGSFVYIGYWTWFMPRLPQPPAAGSAQIAAVADHDVVWTDADTSRCKAAARAAAEAPLPPEMALANPTVAEGFASIAMLLECRITTKVARFCDPQEKAALVAMVNDYLGRVDLVRLGLGVEGAPMAVLGGAFGGEISAGSKVYTMEKDATFAAMDLYHDRVAAGLRALGRGGVVAAADFGGFLGMGVPVTIADIFKGLFVDHRICA